MRHREEGIYTDAGIGAVAGVGMASIRLQASAIPFRLARRAAYSTQFRLICSEVSSVVSTLARCFGLKCFGRIRSPAASFLIRAALSGWSWLRGQTIWGVAAARA